MTDKDLTPHSSDYFGEQRNFWWNKDFIALQAKRWDTHAIKSVLDIGCGMGHWGQLLNYVLPNDAKVIGIDKEIDWVEQARLRALTNGLEDRYSYQLGDAMKLAFPDNSFDMVTCQTMLIHLENPKLAITEFLRVLKPGGLIVVAEPNKIAPNLFLNEQDSSQSIDEILQGVKFHMLCEKGKALLGEGDNSLGEKIPGLFAVLGLENIQVFMADKCIPLYPPYDSYEQQVIIANIKSNLEKEFLTWDRETTKRYFTAGFRHEYPKVEAVEIDEQFKVYWQNGIEDLKNIIDMIDKKEYSIPGSSILYLVSARKA